MSARTWHISMNMTTGSDADAATVSRRIGELLDGSSYDVTAVDIYEGSDDD